MYTLPLANKRTVAVNHTFASQHFKLIHTSPRNQDNKETKTILSNLTFDQLRFNTLRKLLAQTRAVPVSTLAFITTIHTKSTTLEIAFLPQRRQNDLLHLYVTMVLSPGLALRETQATEKMALAPRSGRTITIYCTFAAWLLFFFDDYSATDMGGQVFGSGNQENTPMDLTGSSRRALLCRLFAYSGYF